MIVNSLKKVIRYVDNPLSQLLIKTGFESNALVVLYLHGISANNKDKKVASQITLSHNGITLDGFRNVIKYFTESGYYFVSPRDILSGLANNKKYVLLTFDDGYASNALILPTLKEFKVPAVFFIAVGYVLNNTSFWWDIVYRELLKRKWSLTYISIEINKLKRLKADAINEYIISNFGPNAFRPVGELDRPLTAKELREFSKQPYVYIGNHTMDHAILTNYNEGEIRSQISKAEEALNDITNCNLPIISYPSGTYSRKIIRICRELNFLLGFTIEPEKISVPMSIEGDRSFLLGRFSLIGNDSTILRNCSLVRSDFLLSRSLKQLYRYF